jgi:AraC-like DNA-binding protein
MSKYLIQVEKMNGMLAMLSRVLDIRTTFFDLGESEVDGFNIKGISEFCAWRRGLDPDACARCDRENLRVAKASGEIHIYHCHAGLLEGVVPLHDRRGIYVGAIVFGQVRDKKRPLAPSGAKERRLLASLAESDEARMKDIGELLKFSGEYIVDNEIVRYCGRPWAERMEDFIRENLSAKITLDSLASTLGCSKSFLSHRIPLEFGCSLKKYLLKERMRKAKTLLADGAAVREAASELGFYDEFHFSKEFKRHYGAPPSSFKAR